MSDRLGESFADEVDSDKNKSDVEPKEIPNSNSQNQLTTSDSTGALLQEMPSIFIEEWDEVYTAKDLRDIPVAKTNCIPIIPKKYRKLLENGTFRQNIKKKNVDSEGDIEKKIMTLNDHLKRFGLLEPEKDLSKDLCKESSKATQFRNIAKRSSPASEMKGKEKKTKSVVWSPNLIRHSVSHDENPINDQRMQRSPMEKSKRLDENPINEPRLYRSTMEKRKRLEEDPINEPRMYRSTMEKRKRLEENPIKDFRMQRLAMEDRRRISRPSISNLQNTAKLGQKSRIAYDGNRPPILSLVDRLIKEPVQFELPERKNPVNSKK